MRVTKRQIVGVFQETWAHSTYKGRGGGLIEAFGTCFGRRGAESGVESFEESSCLVVLLEMSLILEIERDKYLRIGPATIVYDGFIIK
jgi:hypothetical protein